MIDPEFVKPLKKKVATEEGNENGEQSKQSQHQKKKKKKSKKNEEIEKRKISWQDHQKEVKKKAKKMPATASFTHRKKESIFKTSDNLPPEASSNKTNPLNNQRKTWTNLLKPPPPPLPISKGEFPSTNKKNPNNEEINKFLSQFNPSSSKLDY